MENFLLGFKALFRAWTDPEFARRVRDLLEEKESIAPAPAAPPPAPQPPSPPPPPSAQPPPAPARSDALTLLAVLQREARLIDFLQEPIAGYSDAQIGAAVRSVHKDAAAVLDRLFAIEPLKRDPDGTRLEIPDGFDPAQVRLVGSIPGQGPYRGTLAHPGWKARRCELPQWNGRDDSAWVIAPCEVEIQ